MKIKLLFLSVILVAADQIAKNIFLTSFCNQNLAWRISITPAIFYSAWIIIVAFLIYLFTNTRNYYQKFFLVLVFSGAVSNLIDRIRFGCVVDYIDFKIFPVFNLADVYITIGAILFLFSFLKPNDKIQMTNQAQRSKSKKI